MKLAIHNHNEEKRNRDFLKYIQSSFRTIEVKNVFIVITVIIRKTSYLLKEVVTMFSLKNDLYLSLQYYLC